MAIDIRRPNITAPTERGQLEQIRSYLYAVSEQLNWAFNTIEVGYSSPSVQTQDNNSSKESSPEEVKSNFNAIKALIIKSADIVDAYYETISKKLEGEYKALSDFGEYTQKTSLTLKESSDKIDALFTNIQGINGTLEKIGEDLDKVIATDAYIRAGELYYDESGAPVYGLEIGQTNTVDGEKVFDKFARFSANKVSFYDVNDVEVGYISDYMLFITNATITGNLGLGGYKYDTSDGIAHIWEGRS